MVDMVKYYKNGWAAWHSRIIHRPRHPPPNFGRMRSVVRFSVVFGSEGSVAPLPPLSGTHPSSSASASSHVGTAADIPSDLDLIFTGRLLDEDFFYLSQRLMTPLALSHLTSGVIGETPLMDNGETTEYKRFLEEVVSDGMTGPRATRLAFVSGVCRREWTRRSMGGWFWFDVQGQDGLNANESEADYA
ncbi:hypothetical protein BDZ89DRAFT_1133725 [Hymenopellis radicata]|nr:hypothetical protein BDZ89DRAFT_1133725 [Hymenopellis radicata]